MSREERKLARIIASIEKMEKKNPSSNNVKGINKKLRKPNTPVNSEDHNTSKKRKLSSANNGFGNKRKGNSTGHRGVKKENIKTANNGTSEYRLPPKKMWIRQWHSHLEKLEDEKHSLQVMTPRDIKSNLNGKISPISGGRKVDIGIERLVSSREYTYEPEVMAVMHTMVEKIAKR